MVVRSHKSKFTQLTCKNCNTRYTIPVRTRTCGKKDEKHSSRTQTTDCLVDVQSLECSSDSLPVYINIQQSYCILGKKQVSSTSKYNHNVPKKSTFSTSLTWQNSVKTGPLNTSQICFKNLTSYRTIFETQLNLRLLLQKNATEMKTKSDKTSVQAAPDCYTRSCHIKLHLY